MQNIIAVVFANKSEGFQAITELRQQPVTDTYAVLQMALVKRQGDRLQLCDGYESGYLSDGGAVLGGLMGSMLGVLGGPLGVLLLGTYGAVAGRAAGTADTLGNAALLEMTASKLVDGEVALLALAEELDEAALDAYLGKFKAEIARFDAAVVAEEVYEAEQIQLEMGRQAVLDLRKANREEHKAAIEDKRAKLDADFKTLRGKRQEKAEASFDAKYGNA